MHFNGYWQQNYTIIFWSWLKQRRILVFWGLTEIAWHFQLKRSISKRFSAERARLSHSNNTLAAYVISWMRMVTGYNKLYHWFSGAAERELSLVAHISKTNSVISIFLFLESNQKSKMKLLAEFKKILYRGFRATLILWFFFKVALILQCSYWNFLM